MSQDFPQIFPIVVVDATTEKPINVAIEDILLCQRRDGEVVLVDHGNWQAIVTDLPADYSGAPIRVEFRENGDCSVNPDGKYTIAAPWWGDWS